MFHTPIPRASNGAINAAGTPHSLPMSIPTMQFPMSMVDSRNISSRSLIPPLTQHEMIPPNAIHRAHTIYTSNPQHIQQRTKEVYERSGRRWVHDAELNSTEQQSIIEVEHICITKLADYFMRHHSFKGTPQQVSSSDI
jgi:hypothetical protein